MTISATTPQIGGNELRRWLTRCLAHRVPFAVCREPGENRVRFFRDLAYKDADAGCCFEIGRWLMPYAERLRLSEVDINCPQEWPEPPSVDEGKPASVEQASAVAAIPEMSREEYLAAVAEIARRCARRNGKTVFSRVIAGNNPSLDLTAAVERLLTGFDGTMRFCYYTPSTGLWMGATPETLLNVDLVSREVRTMALAGTRLATTAQWDEKNLLENRFVSEFIAGKFRALGIEATICGPFTSPYGERLQHLCCDISGAMPHGLDYGAVLDAINPTPALCGTPVEDALADLLEFEPHDRDCYGGFIALSEPGSSLRAYVNLRSCRVAPGGNHAFAVFAGGGITAASDPQTEWHETCHKASAMLSLLNPPAMSGHSL